MDTIATVQPYTTPSRGSSSSSTRLYGPIFGPDSGWAWGLSIVSLVVLIRIRLIPLFVKQIKATRDMQVLQPKMKAIQERYKNDKQRQSEEMMKLYKETGTNPLSSCLPILAQSPFFFALYHVLAASPRARHRRHQRERCWRAPGGAHLRRAAGREVHGQRGEGRRARASLTDVRVVTAIMIVLMSPSQFYTQRQLMTKNVDMTVKTPFMQQQKMLMYVFPVIFAVFGINFPVGVLVYWLTTNVWTMGQQMYVIRQNPTPGSQGSGPVPGAPAEARQHHGKLEGRGEKTIVEAIVAKGRDRNHTSASSSPG